MSKEQNGKTNSKATEEKANGKAKEEQIIPQDVWKEFYQYWDNCEWKDLTKKDIQKHLGDGKYVFVQIPHNVNDKIVGTAWFEMMKSFKEKSQPFGGITVCFAGQKGTLESVFGMKPLKITEVVKQLHFFINDHNLSKKSEPKAKTESKVEEKNGKKTVKVNSIEAMEKAVEKINNKKGKK